MQAAHRHSPVTQQLQPSSQQFEQVSPLQQPEFPQQLPVEACATDETEASSAAVPNAAFEVWAPRFAQQARGVDDSDFNDAI